MRTIWWGGVRERAKRPGGSVNFYEEKWEGGGGGGGEKGKGEKYDEDEEQ